MSTLRDQYIAALRRLPFVADGSEAARIELLGLVSALTPHMSRGTYNNQLLDLRSAFSFAGPPLRCREELRIMTMRRDPLNRSQVLLYHENCVHARDAEQQFKCLPEDIAAAGKYAAEWWRIELHHRTDYGLKLYIQTASGWRPVNFMSSCLFSLDSAFNLCPWSVSLAADTALWEADTLCQAELPAGWEQVVAICGECGGTFNTDEQCHTCGTSMRSRGSLQTSVVPRSIPIGAETALARVGYRFPQSTVPARLQEYAYWQDRMYETQGKRAAAQQKETYLKPGRTIELRS